MFPLDTPLESCAASDNAKNQVWLAKGELLASVDTLTFTTFISALAWLDGIYGVIDTVKSALGGAKQAAVTSEARGINGYKYGVSMRGGVRVSWSPGRADVSVHVPGVACQLLGVDTLLALGIGLDARPSRVDVAMDGCAFSPGAASRAWLRGDASSKVNRDGAKSTEWISSPSGDTFYLGSPSSDRRSRCYTKVDERVYEDGSPVVRWEMQYRHDRAREVWALLVGLYLDGSIADDLGSLTLGLIDDHVRFVNAAKAPSVDEAPLLQWWARFIGSAERVKTWTPRDTEPSIDAHIEWFENNMARSYYIYERFKASRLGGHTDASSVIRAREELRSIGMQKLRPIDKRLLRSCGMDSVHVLEIRELTEVGSWG
jgi:hypothetical protein